MATICNIQRRYKCYGNVSNIIIANMYSSILLGLKKEQFNRYSEAFNFFQSKSINNIIRSQNFDYVIQYRDLEILDDET